MSRLGELLVREKMISLQQLQKAQEEAKRSGRRLGHALTQLGFVKDQDLTSFLAKQYSLPSIDLKEFEIDADVLKLIPKDVARKHMVVPVNRAGATLIVAMSDPSNIYAIDELKFLTQYNIEPVVAAEAAIEEAIQHYYEKGPDLTEIVGEFEADDIDFSGEQTDDVNVVDLEKQSGEAPVVRFCNSIMLAAIKKKASDIHIEPYEKEFRIRYRIDGILYEEMRPPLKLKNAITSRVKIMAYLDISERRLPREVQVLAHALRAAPPAGRPHQAEDRQGQGDGLPRLRPPHPLRGEDRPPPPRQVQPPARHDQAGLRGAAARRLQEGHQPPL